MILFNELRSAFSSWNDRLLAIAAIAIAGATLHAFLAYRPLVLAAWIVAAFAAVGGGRVTGLIRRRLAFHAYDGVLAADALDDWARVRYQIAVHGLALIGVAIVALSARPVLPLFAGPAYLAGALIAWPMTAFRVPTGTGLSRPAVGRTIRAWLRTPAAGVFGAMGALPILYASGHIDPAPRAALIGLVIAAIVLSLTSLDDAIVRFMTISGHRGWSIVARRSRGPLIFLAIVLAICLIAPDWLDAGIVGAMAVIGIGVMAARIFAYRVHSKRVADTIVGIYVVAIGVAGFAAPMLLPFIVPAVLWQLYRRSRDATWMVG